MKDLAKRKTRLRFRTATGHVVEATPDYALVREGRRRAVYAVPWQSVWWLGARMAAEQAVAAKKERKRPR